MVLGWFAHRLTLLRIWFQTKWIPIDDVERKPSHVSPRQGIRGWWSYHGTPSPPFRGSSVFTVCEADDLCSDPNCPWEVRSVRGYVTMGRTHIYAWYLYDLGRQRRLVWPQRSHGRPLPGTGSLPQPGHEERGILVSR
jgi:hypothetical protein